MRNKRPPNVCTPFYDEVGPEAYAFFKTEIAPGLNAQTRVIRTPIRAGQNTVEVNIGWETVHPGTGDFPPVVKPIVHGVGIYEYHLEGRDMLIGWSAEINTLVLPLLS